MLFRMETVSRGSLLISRPQNSSPVSISPMLSLSDAALTEKPAETFGIELVIFYFMITKHILPPILSFLLCEQCTHRQLRQSRASRLNV